MRKSSVYLPDDLKLALSAFAQATGRSEADLIREAIEHHVTPVPAPSTPRQRVALVGPLLVGIGVGPGDPDLITQRALDVLAHTDRVIALSTGTDAIPRAEMTVRAAAPDVRVDRIPLAITGDAPARRRSIAAVAAELIGALDLHQVVAVVTVGDPNVYSVFSDLADAVRATRPTLAVDTVPGVMAFQDLAARTGTVLAAADEHLGIVTATEDLTPLDPYLADPGCTVVIYKGGRHLPALAQRLAACDRLDGAVVGELLGLPGEHRGAVSAIADRPASYLATVVVPATRQTRDERP